ncbi:hypothetical protein LSUE1_G009277, partial [Lachnellula suecica]
MSVGYSIGDGVLLAQLAWRKVKGVRQACGEHGELTREVSSLHRVLERLHQELKNPDSPLSRAGDDRRRELDDLGSGYAYVCHYYELKSVFARISQGRAEKQLNSVGTDLDGIRGKVDWIAAQMAAKNGDGTVWTSYTNDDRSFWRELRRELVKEGNNKRLLKDYVEELGSRGVFDEASDDDVADEDDSDEKGIKPRMNAAE